MPVTNRQMNHFIRRTLYSLKRKYGSTIEIHKVLDSGTNRQTGVKTYYEDITRVRRAAVMPVKVARETNQAISVISANKAFVYGAVYDINVRLFIIDARDLPSGYVIGLDDWVAYNGKRYQIKETLQLEQATGWLVQGRANDAETPTQLHIQHADSSLTLSDSSGV